MAFRFSRGCNTPAGQGEDVKRVSTIGLEPVGESTIDACPAGREGFGLGYALAPLQTFLQDQFGAPFLNFPKIRPSLIFKSNFVM
jgi:hypothetical protein